MRFAAWTAFLSATLVLSTSACHDHALLPVGDPLFGGVDAGLSAADASIVDADDGLLECVEADLARSQRLSVAPGYAERLACANDQDCTDYDPTFKCPSRKVHLGASPRPVARAQLEAQLAVLRALEVELCDSVRIGCVSSGGPVPATPLCVKGECTLRFGPAADAGSRW